MSQSPSHCVSLTAPGESLKVLLFVKFSRVSLPYLLNILVELLPISFAFTNSMSMSICMMMPVPFFYSNHPKAPRKQALRYHRTLYVLAYWEEGKKTKWLCGLAYIAAQKCRRGWKVFSVMELMGLLGHHSSTLLRTHARASLLKLAGSRDWSETCLLGRDEVSDLSSTVMERLSTYSRTLAMPSGASSQE